MNTENITKQIVPKVDSYKNCKSKFTLHVKLFMTIKIIFTFILLSKCGTYFDQQHD